MRSIISLDQVLQDKNLVSCG